MDYKSALLEFLDEENKDKCIELAFEALEKGEFTIPFLYEEILRPSLYIIDNCKDEDNIRREHVRTAIIRKIVECVYPFVIKEKKKVKPNGLTVLLVCPENELHEIGLRMIEDFFSLNGYKTIFIGANTPREQVFKAVEKIYPDYLALSVTDYYILFEAQKMIEKVKEIYKSIKVIVGGNAFKANRNLIKDIGGDIYLESYQDIVNLRKGDADEISI